jgi:hypothetical protein
MATAGTPTRSPSSVVYERKGIKKQIYRSRKLARNDVADYIAVVS